MEQKIKSTFADVKKPVNPAERIYYPIDDNEEPLIYIGKDKEIDAPTINLFFKHEATPREAKGNLGYYLQSYLLAMATDMLNARLGELTQSANPPFTSAGEAIRTTSWPRRKMHLYWVSTAKLMA